MLRQLHESDTGNVHYALALSDMRGRNGDVDGALTTLKPLVPRYPNYAPLNIAYAQALIDIGRPAEARAYLLNDTQLVGQDFQAHELLARAADAQDHDAEAYYRQAEYHHMRGEYAAAIYKLRTGLRLPDLNGEDAQRMQASLARYKRECALAWSAEECRDRVEGTVRR
jgi:predicted Zn-dependent protease